MTTKDNNISVSSKLLKINQLTTKLDSLNYEITKIQEVKDSNTRFYESLRSNLLRTYSIFTFIAFLCVLTVSYFYIAPKYFSLNFFYYSFFSVFFSFCLTYIAYNIYLAFTYNYVSSKMSKYSFDVKLNKLAEQKKKVYDTYINLLFHEN